jgi:uncharacterized protein DUF4397
MRRFTHVIAASAVAVLAACGTDAATDCCIEPGEPQLAVRVFNASASPVDVLLDGRLVIGTLAPSGRGTMAAAPGSHAISFRPSAGGNVATRPITTLAGAITTVAAVRSTGGALGTVVLDDTNSVVPPNATKVRVLHLAANAGTLQVFRTQPDFPQPVAWQFPFTYQAEPNSLSAPFYQSTVGTWEVRIWKTPTDASGWATAPVRVTIPLAGGEKKTVVILDDFGSSGSVRVEVL